MQLFGLLVFNFFLLLILLWLLSFLYNLLLELKSVFLENFFSFLLKLLLKLSDFPLLANGCFEFSFFGSGLFLEHLLLFHLLLSSSHFKLCGFFAPNFGLLSFFLTCSSFIGFNSSFSSQSVELSLSIRSFFLQLSKPLNFFLFLILDSSKIILKNTFVLRQVRLLFGLFLSSRQIFFLTLTFPFVFFVRWWA